MVTSKDFRLDLKPSLPDFRDWQFHLRADLPKVLPTQIDLNPWFTYSQGVEGSCTGNAQAKAFRLTARNQGLPDIDVSRAMIYYNSRLLEGTQNQDAGATIADSIKSLVQWGVCPEDEFPYIEGGYATVPSQDNYSSALAHRALKHEAVQLSHDVIGAALALGHPVSFGFVVWSSFDSIDSRGIVPQPSGSILGAHNMLITGWDLVNMPDYYLIDNSWGHTWGATINGQYGRAWLPRSWVENPQISFEARTIDLVSGTPTPPPPNPQPTAGDMAMALNSAGTFYRMGWRLGDLNQADRDAIHFLAKGIP